MVPKSLKIRGHTYRVSQVNARTLEGASADVDSEANRIRLYKRLTASRKIECLLHEVLHALLEGYTLEEDVEEDVVVTLGEGLTSFIQDNPAFIRHALAVLCK